QPEVLKIDTPEIGGPKILDKIDLSTIDSSTRPKKVLKKKEPNAPKQEHNKPASQQRKEAPAKPAPIVEPTAEVNQPSNEEDAGPVIENIKAEKLEGPKILGKIQLPVAGAENRPRPTHQQG